MNNDVTGSNTELPNAGSSPQGNIMHSFLTKFSKQTFKIFKCLYIWAMLSKIFFSPQEKSDFIFPPIFRKNWPKPPGESKTRCGDSFSINMRPVQANFTDFVNCFHFVFEKLRNDKNKWPKNETLLHLFPTPQPPCSLGHFPRARARPGDSGGGTNSSVRPNGAPVMPI